MSLYDNAVLVMIPNGFKAGTLYSVKPNTATGDFDVARSDPSTRVNEDLYLDGIAANVPNLNYSTAGGCPFLRTDDASENLITYPISLGNNYYTLSGATINSDPSTKGADQNVSTCVNSNYTTFSGASATGFSATSDGGGTHIAGTADEIVVTTSNIIRVSFTLTLNSGTAPTVAVTESLGGANLCNSKTQVSTSGVNDMYFYGSVASTGVVEFFNSSTATDFAISNLSVSSVTGFQSPHLDYPTDAYKLVEDGTTGTHYIRTSSFTSGLEYTYSCYAKAAERSWVFLRDGNNSDKGTYFNLSTGQLGTQQSGSVGSITALVDGWYKCSITYTPTNNAIPNIRLADADNSDSYTGDGTSGLYLAFPQLEEQDYASPLMLPVTEGSTTTRTADAVDLATLQSGSILGTTTGTIVFDVTAFSTVGADTDLWLFEDTGGGDELGLRFTSAEKWQWYDHHSTTLLGSPSASNSCKIGITWSGTSAIVSIDGTNASVTLSAAFDAITDISLGASFPSAKTSLIYMGNTLITATELNALTT